MSQYSAEDYNYKRKGFSLTEVITAIGIVAVLSGVTSMSYMRYLTQSRVAAFNQSANQFFKAADLCMTVKDSDDLTKCNTKAKLKFKCDDCSAITHFAGQAGGLNGPRIPERIDINFKSGDCAMCATYSPSSTDINRKRTTVKCYEWKFCTRTQGYNSVWQWDRVNNNWQRTNTPNSGTGYGARRPFQKCSADSDCKTGEVCHKFPLGARNSNPAFGGVCN